MLKDWPKTELTLDCTESLLPLMSSSNIDNIGSYLGLISFRTAARRKEAPRPLFHGLHPVARPLKAFIINVAVEDPILRRRTREGDYVQPRRVP